MIQVDPHYTLAKLTISSFCPSMIQIDLHYALAKLTISLFCPSMIQVDPHYALAKFVPHCSQKVLDALISEEAQLEEELDKEILFNLQVLAEVCTSQFPLIYGA